MKTIKMTRTQVEGLIILLVAMGYLWEAQNVPSFYQIPGVPGPTAFPVLLGLVFALSGIWLLISSWLSPRGDVEEARRSGEEKGKEQQAGGGAGAGLWQRVVAEWHFYAMWALALSYLFFMPRLGFPVTTILLLAGFFFLLDERRWGVVIGLAVLTTAVLYVGFALGLNVRLPLGILTPLLK